MRAKATQTTGKSLGRDKEKKMQTEQQLLRDMMFDVRRKTYIELQEQIKNIYEKLRALINTYENTYNDLRMGQFVSRLKYLYLFM